MSFIFFQLIDWSTTDQLVAMRSPARYVLLALLLVLPASAARKLAQDAPRPAGVNCSDLQWPESRLALVCMLNSPSSSVANAPGCTVYRDCTKRDFIHSPWPGVCNMSRIMSSLCLLNPASMPECGT